MQSLFFSLQNLLSSDFQFGLIENAICRTRECYYYMLLLKLETNKNITKCSHLFSFANVVVRFRKLELMFKKMQNQKLIIFYI